MAGHSKWSNIKRKKGATDAKRSKLFSKALKEINVAIKTGGTDEESNPALRNAIANARGMNMPKENILRAIKKASGEGADNFEEITFEGYGPFGIAFFIECTTDNTNRTVANIRAIFNKANGSLGTNGSLEFLFERKGVFTIKESSIQQEIEELELELIEHGLDTMEIEGDGYVTVYSAFSDYGTMTEALEELGTEVENSTLMRIPLNTVELPLEQAKKILELEEKFEDDEDVQKVFHNLEITDELIADIEK